MSRTSTGPGWAGAVGGCGELDRDLAAVLLVDKADQRLADQILRHGAEQFAERAIGLLEAAEAVDQRDADRRVGEEALEPLARQAQRGLPFALGGQVAHHRAGAQLVAGADHALADRGVDGAAVAAFQHDLAALPALAAAAERVGRAQVLAPAAAAARKSCSRASLPTISAGVPPSQSARVWLTNRKRPGAIDRIEADRRVVEEIDELVALVADHRLHLVARGDVLEVPEAVAGPARRSG